jgi:hypothetical protein
MSTEVKSVGHREEEEEKKKKNKGGEGGFIGFHRKLQLQLRCAGVLRVAT